MRGDGTARGIAGPGAVVGGAEIEDKLEAEIDNEIEISRFEDETEAETVLKRIVPTHRTHGSPRPGDFSHHGISPAH